jgi:aldehyde:ferredoxin oxidoreductase
MHILKIKGKAKIPDYIQIRDDNFTLKAYFRVDRPEKSLEKLGLGERKDELLKLIEEMPFGKVLKID